MALPTQGTGSVINGYAQSTIDGVKGQGIYDVSSTAKGPVGSKRVLADGRAFRYCYFAGACAAGKLAALDVTSQVVATTAATALRNSAGTAADYAAAATGPVYLLDTDKFTAAHSDGVFDGGYLIHVAGGAQVKIAGSDYTASTSLLKLDIYDSLPIAFDSEDTVQVVGSDFYGLTIAVAGSDDHVVGVPLVAVAAGEYAWVQRSGTAMGFADGTISAGMLLTLSDGTNGAVQEIGGGVVFASEIVTTSDLELAAITTEPFVGNAITAGANGTFFAMQIAFE
jgi:hypothetical protein